ncbi:GrpB family protein [Devosia nitrariae]|uniref:GrpB family protein n=1 Tax=Devosia nitrariae TaxID=2071872 RepID=A0ABQ5WBB2_9HYPH|nr:GrpB family protein [Devosia nitrariae]GLQ57252.1 hypothetical protein GCM10010862_45110 [Devosia nitrariae]
MLGLKRGVNVLVDYDPAWPAEFVAERERLTAALGTIAKGIEHYGSTSVVGMRAKPLLDILVGVLPLADWACCPEPLAALGYDYAENAGVAGHYIFGRGPEAGVRTHLVHVVEFQGESWRSNLAFRQALRGDAALRQAYVAIKEAAVAQAPVGRGKYTALKRDFIDTAKAALAGSPQAEDHP